jgi:hypothetical protein
MGDGPAPRPHAPQHLDPRQRGPLGSTRESHPSDREAAWPAPEPRRRAGGNGGRRIRTNNPLERILREIQRRTRVVGAFPDGQSALNLAAARLRHIAGAAWSTKRYLNIELLKDQQMRGAITACAAQPTEVRKILDTTSESTAPTGGRPADKILKSSASTW